jgi:hypothetical protein
MDGDAVATQQRTCCVILRSHGKASLEDWEKCFYTEFFEIGLLCYFYSMGPNGYMRYYPIHTLTPLTRIRFSPYPLLRVGGGACSPVPVVVRASKYEGVLDLILLRMY